MEAKSAFESQTGLLQPSVRRRTKCSLLILLVLVLSVFNETSSTSGFKGQNSNQIMLSGTVSLWSNSTNGATLGFSVYIPWQWNTSTPIPLEYSSDLTDNTPGRNATYRVGLYIDFYEDDYNLTGKAVFQGVKVLEGRTNTGYPFLDTFRNKKSWNLSSTVTDIPPKTEWRGVVYANGSLRTRTGSVWSTSDKKIITYRDLSQELSGFVVFPIMTLICIYTLYWKKKRKSHLDSQ